MTGSGYELFQKKLGYHFRDLSLLKQAFIHQSYVNESLVSNEKSNERLEFLGDAVLELIVSQILFEDFPDINEGILTQKRIRMVCQGSFAYLGNIWDLSPHLIMGRGAELQGAREMPSILSDTFEAVCGAIYLDGGWDFLYQFFKKTLPTLEEREDRAKSLFHNYKSKIQELCNEKGAHLEYQLLREEGPDHDKIYTTALLIERRKISEGQGKNKKESEQAAAKEALEKIENNPSLLKTGKN